ncbi:MAG: hypothetical protein M1821_005148 [Bathelium mastoideum]|nr:MAG: hypothetical protein M1821_005148 [Bathelium mastoideum]KAI9677799.1 MAG: hypothetical protein M1822_008111 [Bathelium mastoideum]
MNVEKPTSGISLPFTKPRPHEANAIRRLKGFNWMPNSARNHFIAMAGEFVGTYLFLFIAYAGTQVANAAAAGANTAGNSLSQAPNASVLLYIALSFGFSLLVCAWVFFRISGGLFNPAVTLGMALIGAVGWLRGGLVFLAQLLGALCAAAVVSALFPGPLNVKTTLGGGTSIARGLFIEMFLTALLVFTIFMLAAEKHKGTFIAPVGIGCALFICELAGVFFTGGSLNPARSFAPCVAVRSFEGYHWIYWIGPMLGSLLAVAFYKFVKVLEYETANPGQDMNAAEAEAFSEDKPGDEEMGYGGRPGATAGSTTERDITGTQRGPTTTAKNLGGGFGRDGRPRDRAYDGVDDENVNSNIAQPDSLSTAVHTPGTGTSPTNRPSRVAATKGYSHSGFRPSPDSSQQQA